MFLLIWIFAFALKSPCDFAFEVAHRVFASTAPHVAGALRAYHMLGNIAPTAVDMAAIAEAARAIRVFKLDGVMIEDFAIVGSFAHLDAAHALSANGMALLDPVDHVQIVNVLLDDVVATEPDKVIP